MQQFCYKYVTVNILVDSASLQVEVGSLLHQAKGGRHLADQRLGDESNHFLSLLIYSPVEQDDTGIWEEQLGEPRNLFSFPHPSNPAYATSSPIIPIPTLMVTLLLVVVVYECKLTSAKNSHLLPLHA